MGFGGLIQILKTTRASQIFREYTEGFLAFPRSVIQHFNFEKQPIGDVTHFGGIPWSTPSLSPALIGIGYIIGPELASINVSGGVHRLVDPDSAAAVLRSRSAAPHRHRRTRRSMAYTVWYNIVRPIAVGTMLVGAANTMFSMRDSLCEFAARHLHGLRRSGARRQAASTARSATSRRAGWCWQYSSCWCRSPAIYYYFTHGHRRRHHRGRDHDHHRISALRRGRLPGGPGGQLEPAALGT